MNRKKTTITPQQLRQLELESASCAVCGAACCPACSYCHGCKRYICHRCDQGHHGRPDGTNHSGLMPLIHERNPR